MTSSASVAGPSVASWALEECVYICHLDASLVTNCITGAVCWGNLDLTNNDHNIIWARIFCLEWLKAFFCIGVFSWTSCDCFTGKNKTEGMRHACPLLWELQHEKKTHFKFWCTLIDPFLCFSPSMVNIPEIYTSSKQRDCSHSCPLLSSDPFYVICTEHVKCHETTVHGLVVCLLCRTCTPHCCLFC